MVWDSGLQAACLMLRIGRLGQTHCRWLPSVCDCGSQGYGEPCRRSGGGRLFGRAGGGNAQVGSRRVRDQTKVDGPPRRCTTSAASGSTAGSTTSSSCEHHYRESVVLAQSSAADRPHSRSHSGPGASSVLLSCPSGCEFQIQLETFRELTLERLRLPLLFTDAQCECGAPVDHLDRHRGACPHSGRLKRRAMAPERTLARVCGRPRSTSS